MDARVGPCTPPGKNPRLFPHGEAFSSCGDFFANFLLPFLHVHGGPFWACPPPPYKTFCGRLAMQWCSPIVYRAIGGRGGPE